MPTKKQDVTLWLERASEARTRADATQNPDARRELLEIAAAYERIAAVYAGRSPVTPPKPTTRKR